MSTIPALQSALTGVQTGMQSLNNNSAKIANAQSNGDITEPLVNLLQDEQQVKASAKVLEATNSMLGSILDIKV
jgi:flagellar hook-associated protein FlgK